MSVTQQMMFKPFRLDPDNACLWRGGQRVSLTPKAFMVLLHLVRHPGQLVTKDALLEAVWPDAMVGDAVLKVCIREIRQALGDTVKTPQFIATEYRKGYRFIKRAAPVDRPRMPQPLDHPLRVGSSENPCYLQNPSYNLPQLVGREGAFTSLHGWLEQAIQGIRHLVFMTGEAGIGKTALVKAFAAQASAVPSVRTLSVECIEWYGPSEAYLPILEAIGRLCRAPEGHRLTALLKQYAPTWLSQMPWLMDIEDYDALHHRLLNSTQEQMLRELAEVIEALAADAPLVLVLEDLHWSDYATLDLILLLARRQESARLLMIGTYRPVEVIVSGHPLKAVKQVLEMQGRCIELPLELLSQGEVATYVEGRFQGGKLPASLVQLVYQRTDGNPLFMVNMVEYLLVQRTLSLHNGLWTLQTEIDAIEIGVPESLRQMIEQQLERLMHEEQRIIEAASVMGMEFSAAAVATVLEKELAEIEDRCDMLVRRHHLLKVRGVAEWPDGTAAARYGFLHWLYQHVSYQRLGVTQRVRLHQQIGRCLEDAYGQDAGQIAAELAMHFARGRDVHRAILYLQYASRDAARRLAYREAVNYLTRALKLVERLPTAERANVRMKSLKERALVRRAGGDSAGAEEDFAALAQCQQHDTFFQQQSLFA